MFSRYPRRLLLLLGLFAVGSILLAVCVSIASTSAAKPEVEAPYAASLSRSAAGSALSTLAAPTTATLPGTIPAAKVPSHKGVASSSPTASAQPTAGGGLAVADDSSGPVFGIAAPELLGWSTTEQVQQLEAMKDTGITSIRVDASWYNTQPNGADSYNWTPLDNVVSSIHKAGLTADLIIDGCPPWAAASGASGQFAQPASPTEFGDWAAAVAKRYDGEGANYFEIWNEPNNPAFWSPAPNPAAYTADLEAAYAAIKAVDPAAVVLTGGLAPEANSSNSYNPVTFFEDMYADGAQGSFDGVGDHPYTYPYAPDTVSLGSAWTRCRRPAHRCVASWSHTATRRKRSGSRNSERLPAPEALARPNRVMR